MPVLGLVSFSYMEYTFVADRFTYLASIGLCALTGSVVGPSSKIRMPGALQRFASFCLALFLTFRRCLAYRA